MVGARDCHFWPITPHSQLVCTSNREHERRVFAQHLLRPAAYAIKGSMEPMDEEFPLSLPDGTAAVSLPWHDGHCWIVEASTCNSAAATWTFGTQVFTYLQEDSSPAAANAAVCTSVLVHYSTQGVFCVALVGLHVQGCLYDRALLVMPMVALLILLREIGKVAIASPDSIEASAASWGGASWPLERRAYGSSAAVNAGDPIVYLWTHLARVTGYQADFLFAMHHRCNTTEVPTTRMSWRKRIAVLHVQ